MIVRADFERMVDCNNRVSITATVSLSSDESGLLNTARIFRHFGNAKKEPAEIIEVSGETITNNLSHNIKREFGSAEEATEWAEAMFDEVESQYRQWFQCEHIKAIPDPMERIIAEPCLANKRKRW